MTVVFSHLNVYIRFMNKFDDSNEQELIELFKKGDLNEDDFDMLIEAMKVKGMKGIISEVNPNNPEGKEMIEYINFHQKLPRDYQNKTQILKAQKFLSQKTAFRSDLNKLKTAIMILAHSGELKSLEILQRYNKNPHSKLHGWLQMAIDECQTFLESDILNRPLIKIFPSRPNK